MKTIYRLHKKGKVPSSHAVIYALCLMGHTLRRIAPRFGIKKSRVQRIESATREKIAQELNG